jgi:hypothetical protein
MLLSMGTVRAAEWWLRFTKWSRALLLGNSVAISVATSSYEVQEKSDSRMWRMLRKCAVAAHVFCSVWLVTRMLCACL